MTLRRKAREASLQILYQNDLTTASTEQSLLLLNNWLPGSKSENVKNFARELIVGVIQKKTVLDELIDQYSRHWRIKRMAITDRNVLRLGVYEILFCHKTPVKVIIDEAVEIARKFGSEESASFVNGILDAVARAEGRIEASVDEK